MKKQSYNFPFKSNFFKEQDPFHLVLVFFIIFFGTAIFFSVPTFYDYQKYNQQIEKTINNEFKVKIHNLENISFRFIPSPHLLIKKANLKIDDTESESISEFKNLKVFISILDLYKHDEFKIKKVVANKANLYLNKLSLNNFIYNLKKNIVGNFIIKKSTIFFKDEEDEIILISKIKNLDYKIDLVNNKKILKINGNIFDADYEYKYLIDYDNPHIQEAFFDLKNPNFLIENSLIENYNSEENGQYGNIIINFLNKKNIINYEINGSSISFIDKSEKNSDFDLFGYINFKPFHFDLKLNLKKIKLLDLENFLYLIYKNRNLKQKNLSGNMNIIFENIENKAIKNGLMTLIFENSQVSTNKEFFYIDDFAIIEIKDYLYLENIEQILQMKIKINILDRTKFNKFLFNYKKNRIKSDTLYFTYQFNTETKNSFISQVRTKGFGSEAELYKFSNLQQLKNLLKEDNLFKLD